MLKFNYFKREMIMGVLLLTANNVFAGTDEAKQLIFPSMESEISSNCSNSPPINFDLILDEKISIDDPRLKSVIYISIIRPGSMVKIVYTNQNAKDLSERLASILTKKGVKVSIPQLVQPARKGDNSMRYATLWVIYPKCNSIEQSLGQVLLPAIMESK